MILQAMDSNNSIDIRLKDGFIPIKTVTYNGIGYIFSVNPSVSIDGKYLCEIGTYPSPDYNNMVLVNGNYEGVIQSIYSPLKNFQNNDLPVVITNGLVGDFTTELLDFQLNKALKIEIQNSYDGTINLCFTDNYNKPRIVNTRLAITGEKFKIIDRSGADSNVYNRLSFDTTINLIQTTKKLTHIEFIGLSEGGSLKAGNYTYYFVYSTQDGNRTDVFAESLVCSVFNVGLYNNTSGQSYNNLASEYNKTTNKVELELTNVDTQYPYIEVYYVYEAGLNSSIPQCFKIVNKYTTDSIVNFIHYGFEETELTNIDLLSLKNTQIATARAICQLQNRLFLGNITQVEYDYNTLIEHAKTIKIKEVLEYISHDDLTNTEDVEYLSDQVINFKFGYANPKNIYYNLGYWGAEAYVFGIVYIYEDGSESPVFALKGADNSLYNPVYSSDDFDKSTGGNTRGVYRFGERGGTSLTNSNLLYSNNGLHIKKVAFDFTDSLNYPKGTIGCKFVRSDRKKDCIAQGYVINTMCVPTVDYINGGGDNADQLKLYAQRVGYKEKNFKLIPTFNFILEANRSFAQGGSENDINRNGLLSDSVVHPFKFNTAHQNYNLHYTKNDSTDRHLITKFAFISPDVINSEIEYTSVFSNLTAYGKALNKVEFVNAAPLYIPSDYGYLPSPPGEQKKRSDFYPYVIRVASLYKPIELKVMSSFNDTTAGNGAGNRFFKLNADFVPGHLNQATKNNFSCVSSFMARIRQSHTWNILKGSNDDKRNFFFDFRLSFNSYVGIAMNNQNLFTGRTPSDKGFTVSDIQLDHFLYESYSRLIDKKDYGNEELIGDISNDAGEEGIAIFNLSNTLRGEYYDNYYIRDTATVPLHRHISAAIVNIYPSNNIRTNTQLRDLLKPEQESFYSISNKMYWNENFIEETTNIKGNGYFLGNDFIEYDKTLQGYFNYYFNKQGLRNTIVLSRGDCFIGTCYRRLYFNRSQVDKISPEPNQKVNVGQTLQIITENNYNPYLRNTQVVDVNEPFDRSFSPLLNTSKPEYSPINGLSGEIPVTTKENYYMALLNNFRTYRQPESTSYNKGFKAILGYNRGIGYNVNLPFVRTRFNTRIYYTSQNVNNTFENLYRYIFSQNYQDYSSKLGEIVDLKVNGNNIICIQQNGVSYIPISERVLTAESSAGAVFVDGRGVLPFQNQVTVVNDNYGSNWDYSICQTDNSVYGVDVERTRIWRIAASDLEMISEYKIQDLLEKILPNLSKKEFNIILSNAITYYDYTLGDIYFTFYYTSISEYTGIGQPYIRVLTLAQYIDGVATGVTKPNVEGDVNYIPIFPNECPYVYVPNPTTTCPSGQIYVNGACRPNGTFAFHIEEVIEYSTIVIYQYSLIGYDPLLIAQYGNRVTTTNGVVRGLSQPMNYNDVNITTVPFTYDGITYQAIDKSLAWEFNIRLVNSGDITLTGNVFSFNYVYKHSIIPNDAENTQAMNNANYKIELFLGSLLVDSFLSNTLHPDNAVLNYTKTLTNTGVYKIIITAYNSRVIQTGTTPPTEDTVCIQNCIALCTDPDPTAQNECQNNCYNPNTCPYIPGTPIYELVQKETSKLEFYLFVPEGQLPQNKEEWRPLTTECVSLVTTFKNIIYNEKLSIWITQSDLSPSNMFTLYDNLYSFNLLENKEELWKHRNTSKYANFYGKQFNSEIEFVSGGDSINISKAFDNLMIIGNETRPDELVMTNDNDNVRQEIISRINGNIFKANHRYQENFHYIQLGKNITSTPTTDRRIRDKYTKFRCIYKQGYRLFIKNYIVEFRQSFH